MALLPVLTFVTMPSHLNAPGDVPDDDDMVVSGGHQDVLGRGMPFQHSNTPPKKNITFRGIPAFVFFSVFTWFRLDKRS